ncbi:hypothetical protein DP49_5621 [Burkholderia pseudomallei]|nr:hypothetical protein DP49_5621 [Burkholderia pseudomallei]
MRRRARQKTTPATSRRFFMSSREAAARAGDKRSTRGIRARAHAVRDDRIEHRIVLADRGRAADVDARMHGAARIDQPGQIAPDVAALAEEHRNHGDRVAALCGERGRGRGERRLHQFEKREHDARLGAARRAQLRREALERPGPAHVARAVTEKDDSVFVHRILR